MVCCYSIHVCCYYGTSEECYEGVDVETYLEWLDGDSVYSVWKNEDDDSTVILFDPKAVFTDQIQDTTSEFTMYHFIAHMENMRMKLPEEDFINHKEWVFNKYPNKVPTFRQLLRGLLNCLLTCVARSFLR